VDEALTAGRYGVDHAAVLLGVAHNATRTRSGSGPYTDPTLTLTGTINPDSTLHLDHRATTRTGDPLSQNDTDLATGDAHHTILQLDPDGVALTLGHSERHATPGQRRTLTAHDGGCTSPGCDTPPQWCDAHHIHHWQHGGRTDLDNLTLLCRHHHAITHRTSWTLTIDAAQRLEWTTPTGTTIHGQRNGEMIRAGPRAGPAPPTAAA
jgi:hypothetical protein